MEQNNQKSQKVPWAIFIAVVSLLVIGIGWNLSRTETLAKQIEVYKEDVQTTKILLASMATDLTWIKANMVKLQEALDKINK